MLRSFVTAELILLFRIWRWVYTHIIINVRQKTAFFSYSFAQGTFRGIFCPFTTEIKFLCSCKCQFSSISPKVESMSCLRHRPFEEKFSCAGLRQYLQSNRPSVPAYPNIVSKPISKKSSTHYIWSKNVCEQVANARVCILAENPYSFIGDHIWKRWYLFL